MQKKYVFETDCSKKAKIMFRNYTWLEVNFFVFLKQKYWLLSKQSDSEVMTLQLREILIECRSERNDEHGKDIVCCLQLCNDLVAEDAKCHTNCRVGLNGPWFVIHDDVLNFHDWIFCYHKLFHDKVKRYKSMELSMNLWHLNHMKVITLKYVDCVFFACNDSFNIVHNRAN